MPKRKSSNRSYKKKRVLTGVKAHQRHVFKKVPVHRAAGKRKLK